MKLRLFSVLSLNVLSFLFSASAFAQTPHIEWALESYMGKYEVVETNQPCEIFGAGSWARKNGIELKQYLATSHSRMLGGVRVGDRVVEVMTYADSHRSMVQAARPFEGVNNGKVEGRSSPIIPNEYVTHTTWDENSRVLEMNTEVYPEVGAGGYAKGFTQHRLQRIEFINYGAGLIFTRGEGDKTKSCEFRKVPTRR